MYQIIERYRQGSQLMPEVVRYECATIAQARAWVRYAIPPGQAQDWIIRGHGREVPCPSDLSDEHALCDECLAAGLIEHTDTGMPGYRRLD